MLELSILGFLAEEPLHGYELKERIKALNGHVRPVSDGALYPAITRLVTAGKLSQHTEPGSSAAPRRILSLTDQGREDLLERLRRPKQAEITDQVRFNTVLAFLRHLPDPGSRRPFCGAVWTSSPPPRASSTATENPYARRRRTTCSARASCGWHEPPEKRNAHGSPRRSPSCVSRVEP